MRIVFISGDGTPEDDRLEAEREVDGMVVEISV